MQGLETHALALVFSEGVAAGHIGKAVKMATVPDAPSLTAAATVGIMDVDCAETGAGDAGCITAPAGNTALIIFLPHCMGKNFGRHGLVGRKFYGNRVFANEFRLKVSFLSRKKRPEAFIVDLE